ncbi:MAG: SusC/RagA family TonB-linked outer membrane protein [Hymenobacter sp.]|nr:SusC/RagA family TonB-linked outer membrane protein [Hymenobacter sp.]
MVMLRLLWLITLGLARPAAAPPAHTYRGLVVDSSHRPLVGASIIAKGTHSAATTNSEGRFELLLPAGAYELLVEYPGYLAPRTLVGPADSVLTVVMYSTRPRTTRR